MGELTRFFYWTKKVLAAFTFLFVVSNCQRENGIARVVDERIYMVIEKDYEAFCTTSKYDAINNILYPSRCTIQIIDFNKHKYRAEILRTTPEQWINLLKSKTKGVSRSASIWLYFLSKEDVEQVALRLINLDMQQNNQVKFWQSYFTRKKNNSFSFPSRLALTPSPELFFQRECADLRA